MALPKETQERIKADAKSERIKWDGKIKEGVTEESRHHFLEGIHDGYIAGATAESERAQKLVNALEWIKTYGPVDDLTIKFIDKALNEWNGAVTPSRPCPHCGKIVKEGWACSECSTKI